MVVMVVVPMVMMIMVVIMIMLVLVNRHHRRHVLAKEMGKFRVSCHGLRRAGTANMVVQTDHLLG